MDSKENNKDNEVFFAKNCKHLFVEDYIDSMNPYKEGIYIKYCEYCGLEVSYIEVLIEEHNKSKKLKKLN